MPPDEPRRRTDQALRLPGEQQLQEMRTFAKRDAGERAEYSDQRGPEDDSGEILVSEEDQPESCYQRER